MAATREAVRHREVLVLTQEYRRDSLCIHENAESSEDLMVDRVTCFVLSGWIGDNELLRRIYLKYNCLKLIQRKVSDGIVWSWRESFNCS